MDNTMNIADLVKRHYDLGYEAGVRDEKSKHRWIPVSEGLPDDNVSVNVCYIHPTSLELFNGETAYVSNKIWHWYDDLGTKITDVEIKYWAPMMPPPKE